MLNLSTVRMKAHSKQGLSKAEHLLWSFSLSDKLQNGYDAWSFHHDSRSVLWQICWKIFKMKFNYFNTYES